MKSIYKSIAFLLLCGMLLPDVGRSGNIRFFRLTFPEGSSEDARIVGLTSDGMLTWTNMIVGATATVERATTLQGPTNWHGLFQTIVTNLIMVADVNFVPVPEGMVLIPGGTNSGTDPDIGAYSLTVDPFYMDQHPVTKGLWDDVRAWAMTNEYDMNLGQGKESDYPVHNVNWFDAVKWCNARSEREGIEPVYYEDAAFTVVYRTDNINEPYVNANADGYRLPTEIQWMYAARGGVANQRFPWGNFINHDHANYTAVNAFPWDDSPHESPTFHPAYAIGDHPYTSPVGSFDPNGYGLYDMIGNVQEWCYDWDPSNVGTFRVFYGGSWNYWPSGCRITDRLQNAPGYSYNGLGFRTIRPE